MLRLSLASFVGIAAAALVACSSAPEVERDPTPPPRILESDKLVAVAARAIEPTAVAGDVEHIYVTASDTVWRIPLAGGAATKLVPSAAPSLIAADGIAMDERTVLWTERGAPPLEATVRVAPKEGGDAAASAATLTPEETPLSIAVFGANVYFSARDGTIREAPKGGGTSRILARGQWSLAGLYADETGVYWAPRGDGPGEHGVVRRVSRNGTEMLLGEAVGAIGGLAFDATCIYFSDLGDGAIKMVWRDGGHLDEMATGLERPTSLALDDLTRTLYFLTEGPAVDGQPPARGAGGVWKMSVTDVAPPTQLAADLTLPRGLALIGDPNLAPGLAWTQLFDASKPEGARRGTVFKMAR